jgi:hypothetical protein
MYVISVPPRADICTAQPGGAKQKDEGKGKVLIFKILLVKFYFILKMFKHNYHVFKMSFRLCLLHPGVIILHGSTAKN